MSAFYNQLEITKPPGEVFGLAVAAFTKSFGRSGFMIQEQDPQHIIWSRSSNWGWLWNWHSPERQRITMSFAASEAAPS